MFANQLSALSGFPFLIIIRFVLVISMLFIVTCKRSDRDFKKTDTPYYPVYIDQPFTVPDTLHYFYNTVNANGIALSGGEFSVFLKYPVFRSEDKKIERLVDWLDDEVFILAHNGRDDKVAIRNRYKANYSGYANYTLNSWLATEETTKMGCMQESLAVEVAMNSEIITVKVHHKGYWGGAHGDDNVKYVMFSKSFEPISTISIIHPSKINELNRMLISEYKKNIEPWRDYDDDYKTSPDYMALVPEGLIVIYPGYANAEGQPTMMIKPKKFVHLLKPLHKSMYR
jgi:ABC-type cobalt transport system substrate-binding protein